jgi:hypothetical protein
MARKAARHIESVDVEGVDAENVDVVWGAASIGDVIGRNVRSTFHLLESGLLPARKVGGVWAADREALRAFFRTPTDRADRGAQ